MRLSSPKPFEMKLIRFVRILSRGNMKEEMEMVTKSPVKS